jgi:ketosteroid isomerase-like protein
MLTGGCLCGAVRFEIDGALGPITCCHCSLCRRSSGSAFVAAASVDAGYFRVTKGEDVLGDHVSSPQNHRHFCTRCGSQLFGRHDAYPIVRVRVGTVDGDPGGHVAAHFMMDSKASWFDVRDDAEQFPELPPVTYFLPDATLVRRDPLKGRANVGIVARVYDAFRTRNLPEVFGLLDPDIEIYQASEVPWGGVYRGHEGVGQFFAKLTGKITSTVTVERYIDAGDQVVALGRTSGTTNDGGRHFDVRIAHVWTLRDGRVSRVEYYIDDPTMLAAL